MTVVLENLTKQELLLLAAKSIGFDPYVHDGKLYSEFQFEGTEGKDWDPMEDPGDALLLAIQLQISVHNEQLGAGSAYCMGYDYERQEELEYPTIHTASTADELTKQDYRDTYRAIVYAAATIALEMEDEQTEGS